MKTKRKVSINQFILRKGLFIILALSFSIAKFQAQIGYTQLGPLDLIQYLVEPGAVVSNVQFSGDPLQFGLYTQLENVGYGMPLSTAASLSNHYALSMQYDYEIPGGAQSISAYTPPLFGGPFYAMDSDIYADLLNVSQSAMDVLGFNYLDTVLFDPAVLEFDVLATSDTLSFEYVLSGGEFIRGASCLHGEGSLSYAGDCYFHDVFAIFVAGPGISGSYSAPEQYSGGSVNVAFVPDSNPLLTITSESIGDSTNSSFWIPYWDLFLDANDCEDPITSENCDSLPKMSEIGFTTLLNNKIAVTCGQTYHIRIAIADVFDHIYSMGSLINPIIGTANGGENPEINVSFEPQGDSEWFVYEDCDAAWINITRSQLIPLNEPDTIFISSSGLAIDMIDYESISSVVVIPPGETSISFPLVLVQDGIDEPMESLVISCVELHNGDQTCEISASIYILDSPEDIEIANTQLLVCSDTLIVDPEISGGYGEYTYQWPDGSSGTSFTFVDPTIDQEVFVIVDDICSFEPDTVWFDLIIFDPLTVDLSVDSVLYTCNTLISLYADIEGGFGEYDINWQPYGAFNETTEYDYNTALGPQTVYISVIDACEIPVLDSVVVYTLADATLYYSGEDTIYTNCNGELTLVSGMEGGFEPYTTIFLDGFNLQFGSSASYSIEDTTLVVILTYDACGQFLPTNVLIIPGPEPLEFFLPDTTNLLCSSNTPLEVLVQGGFGNLIYQWYENTELTNFDENFYLYEGTDTGELVFLVSDECGQVLSDTTQMYLQIDPLLIASDAMEPVSCIQEVAFEYSVSGGQGPFEYSWIINDVEVSDAQYFIGMTFSSDILVELQITDICQQLSELIFFVDVESQVLLGELFAQELFCGQPGLIESQISGGDGELTYQWQIGIVLIEGDSVLEYEFTGSSQEVQLTVVDACDQVFELSEIFETTLLPFNVELSEEIGIQCSESIQVVPTIESANGEIEYNWFFNEENISNEPSLESWNPGSSGQLILYAMDACGAADTALVDVEVVSSILTVELSDSLFIDCASSLSVYPILQGNSFSTIFVWTFNDSVVSDQLIFSEESWTESGELVLWISDPCANSVTDTVEIILNIEPLDIYIADDHICESANLIVSAEVFGGNGNLFFEWNGLQSEQSFWEGFVNESIELTVSVEDMCSQIASDTSIITLHNIESEIIWEDNGSFGTFTAMNANCPDCIFSWYFGSSTSAVQDSIVQYPYPAGGELSVTLVSTDAWCADTALISLVPPASYFIPNSFTPDNDGLNDVFGVYAIGLNDFELFIFNRWGELVFYSIDPESRWTGNRIDGEHYCANGVYLYQMKAIDQNNNLIEEKGHINLLR